jgi:hypothetical protein
LETVCLEDWERDEMMELAQDHNQWQALVLALLNVQILLPQC